jgi:hypothetical protein
MVCWSRGEVPLKLKSRRELPEQRGGADASSRLQGELLTTGNGVWGKPFGLDSCQAANRTKTAGVSMVPSGRKTNVSSQSY